MTTLTIDIKMTVEPVAVRDPDTMPNAAWGYEECAVIQLAGNKPIKTPKKQTLMTERIRLRECVRH